MNLIRQGDVLLRPTRRKIVRDKAGNITNCGAEVAPEKGRVVLAKGEHTGHYHSLPYGGALLYRDEAGGATLDVKSTMEKFEHLLGMKPTGEHAALDVPKGTYDVIQQHGLSPDQASDSRVWD